MSGATCGGCGNPYIKRVETDESGKLAYCDYCGWKGDISKRPRKMLTPESYKRWSTRLKRLRDKTLFLIHIYVDKSQDDRVVSKVMSIMGLKSISSRDSSAGSRVEIDIDERPSEDTLNQIRAIPGVISAEIRQF